jgi:hypothetical protein
MKMKISFRQVLKNQDVPKPIEFTDVREVNANFETGILRVRYGIELSAARTTQWAEYALSEVSEYDWEGQHVRIDSHALAMHKARKDMEEFSNDRNEIANELIAKANESPKTEPGKTPVTA